MNHILVVDDDSDIRDVLGLLLQRHGFAVTCVADGVAALDLLARQHVDLLVLDVNMPGPDGLEVCRQLRERAAVLPILFLSALGREADKVAGLMAGGDDYLVKPFSSAELVARITAQLRRVNRFAPAAAVPDNPQCLRAGVLQVDLDTCRVRVAGQPVTLTEREFRLLALLARRPERVFSLEELHQGAWDNHDPVADKTIMAHISNLRHKLGAAGGAGLVETVWGFGYRLRSKT